MARFRGIRSGSWPVVFGAGLLVVVAWGLYAWRFVGVSESPADSATPSAVATGAAPSVAGGVEEKITPLRANRPAPHDDRLGWSAGASTGWESSSEGAGLSVAITANAPPSSLRGIELSIGQVVPPTDASASRQLQAGRAALGRGDLVTARASLSAAFDRRLGASEMNFARVELERIADALLFSPAIVPQDPLTGVHVVASGESLHVIAQRCGVTEALLATMNGITNPNLIRAGARLKIAHGPFHAVIHKTAHRMDIFLGDVLVRSYRVGLGTNGGTPLGTWVVKSKLRNPDWTDPSTGRHYLADDPDNPIGECWIGLRCIAGEGLGRDGFGIHGTIDAASIGENFSMGCIRLLPDDVSAVYDLLVRRRSQVIIK